MRVLAFYACTFEQGKIAVEGVHMRCSKGNLSPIQKWVLLMVAGGGREVPGGGKGGGRVDKVWGQQQQVVGGTLRVQHSKL